MNVKPPPPPPKIIRCPNCDEESLRYHPREKVWRCDNCGYQEVDK